MCYRSKPSTQDQWRLGFSTPGKTSGAGCAKRSQDASRQGMAGIVYRDICAKYSLKSQGQNGIPPLGWWRMTECKPNTTRAPEFVFIVICYMSFPHPSKISVSSIISWSDSVEFYSILQWLLIIGTYYSNLLILT